MENVKKYDILSEFDLYCFNGLYYTVEELSAMGLVCYDSNSIRQVKYPQKNNITYFDNHGCQKTIDFDALVQYINNVEYSGIKAKVFCKFDRIGNDSVAILFDENYALSFMDKIYVYPSPAVRKEKSEMIFSRIGDLHEKICDSICGNVPGVVDYQQKQLFIQQKQKIFDKIIPNN